MSTGDNDRRAQVQKLLVIGFFVLPIVLTLVIMLSPPFHQLRERNRLHNEQLLAVVERGDMAQVKALLREGASVNADTPSGLTALSLAIIRGHEEIALLLIEHGASLGARDRTGYLREMNRQLACLLRCGLRAHARAASDVRARCFAQSARSQRAHAADVGSRERTSRGGAPVASVWSRSACTQHIR